MLDWLEAIRAPTKFVGRMSGEVLLRWASGLGRMLTRHLVRIGDHGSGGGVASGLRPRFMEMPQCRKAFNGGMFADSARQPWTASVTGANFRKK